MGSDVLQPGGGTSQAGVSGRYSRHLYISRLAIITEVQRQTGQKYGQIFAERESVQEKRINFVTRMNEPRPPFWRMKVPRILLSWTVLAVLCAIVSISLLGVILYRQSGAISLVQILFSDWLNFTSYAPAITTHPPMPFLCLSFFVMA